MIKWHSRPQLAIANLRAFDRAIHLSGELDAKLLSTHHEIEDIVVANLLSTTTRDPSRTDPTGLNEIAIAGIITSTVTKHKNGLTGGTGNIEFMDQNDPLVTTQGRMPSNDNIRLWRLLEWGTEVHDYDIRARNPQNPMVFWWKRENTLFVGVPGKAPHDMPIIHPGQEGREYWENSMYDAEGVFQTNMHAALQLIVSRYSNR